MIVGTLIQFGISNHFAFLRRRMDVYLANRIKVTENDVCVLIDCLSQNLLSGMTCRHAISQASAMESLPIALRRLLLRLQMTQAQGVGFSGALQETIRYLPSHSPLKPLLQCLKICQDSGSPVAPILDQVRNRIQTQQDLKRNLRTATTQIRFQALCICLSPFLLGLILWFLFPENISFFFATAPGNALLLLMAASQCAGCYFVKKISTLDLSDFSSRTQKSSCTLDLIIFIDFFNLYLQSGCTHLNAFLRSSEQIPKGLLRCAIDRVQCLVSSGHSFRQALLCCEGAPHIKEIFGTVENATRSGASLSQALINLGCTLQTNWKSDHDQRIAKASIKMLLPIAVFLLPVVLLLIGAGPIRNLILSVVA